LIWSGAALGQDRQPSEAKQKQLNAEITQPGPEAENKRTPKTQPDTDARGGKSISPQKPEEKTETEQPDAQREANDIARRDLTAQLAMASATEHMKFSAWIQVGIGIIALFLLFLTVRYTKTAADHTKNMLNTAKEGVVDARLNAERQLRAYVYVDGISISWAGRVPEAVVVIKNLGQTPAYRTTNVFFIGDGEDNDFANFEYEHPLSRDDLPPGGIRKATIKFESFDTNLTVAATSGLHSIYIWGRIEYIDAFNQPQWTEYRHRMGRKTKPEVPVFDMEPCPDGNKST
tara:strand:+ start:552 stop:1418 length:867 start_codon:yes stop_codon:yes gene_type:complete